MELQKVDRTGTALLNMDTHLTGSDCISSKIITEFERS